jgi:voltage-gated potassium channel
MQSSLLKKFPAQLVSTLIFLNGVVTIVIALFPGLLKKLPQVYQASRFLQYTYFQQASFIITMLLGLMLVYLGWGLYLKKRSSWLMSVGLLALLIIAAIYPKLNIIQLCLAVVSLIVLVLYKKSFTVVTESVNRQSWVAWLSALVAVLYGTLGSYALHDQFKNIHSLTDAFYYTVVTYSTVGYGDVSPITGEAKLFVVTMILVGLAAFAAIITMVIGPMIQEKLKKVFAMVESISQLKNHAILCGLNPLTLELAKGYVKKKVTVLFIVDNPNDLKKLDEMGYHALLGNMSDQDIIRQASLVHASYCVCALDDDAQNILITMKVANATKGKHPKHPLQLITIIRDESNEGVAKDSGATQVIVPSVLVGRCLFG